MFVKNNILFCLDDCLVLKLVKAVCLFICTWNLVSLFLKVCHHKMELQLSCSPFFALLCSSCLVKNSPRGIVLD